MMRVFCWWQRKRCLLGRSWCWHRGKSGLILGEGGLLATGRAEARFLRTPLAVAMARSPRPEEELRLRSLWHPI